MTLETKSWIKAAAARCNCSEGEIAALLQVRDAIARSSDNIRTTFWLNVDDKKSRRLKKFHIELDMGVTCSKSSHFCDTVACIGGSVGLIIHRGNVNVAGKYVEEFESNSVMAKLYYPLGVKNWKKLTPIQLVLAINNTIYSGDPRWHEIVPRSNITFVARLAAREIQAGSAMVRA
jgi:hypothetical protein